MRYVKTSDLSGLVKLVRHHILTSTTAAGSGHPSSSLSGVELMTALLFGGVFRFDLDHPEYPNNDRLIFSKGHASPLFYALWAAAGKVSTDELKTLRKFGSKLEGHPTMAFPYTEAATGSLGQGLSIGVGMALNAKLDKLPYRTYVLLGDSEMTEGSQWEAMLLAAHYKLDNLVGVLDVNRLGQRGPTMFEHRVAEYTKRVKAFGWSTIVVDGHNLPAVLAAYKKVAKAKGKPNMIIAKTLKGKGVSFIENQEGWHGRALKAEELEQALKELGEVDLNVLGEVSRPSTPSNSPLPRGRTSDRPADPLPPLTKGRLGGVDGVTDHVPLTTYHSGKPVSTRKAYGNALERLAPAIPNLVVLDAEVSNSTYAEQMKKVAPERFFEMYIAEQNMVGAALGFSRRGKIPFVSTFAAFFTRAYDQIRMSQYSDANIKFVGSHGGVSIGEDGSSQMGLEDLAMFRAILGSVVLCPSDAIAAERLVEAACRHRGIVYLRTTRKDTPIHYKADEQFSIGGSKVLRSSPQDAATVVAAGITVHEALAAYEELKASGKMIRVIDLYSIKPLDVETLKRAAQETKAIITVEDHFAEGGLGEAVASALADTGARVHILAVRKMPKSGKPDELLDYEGISRNGIIKAVNGLTRR